MCVCVCVSSWPCVFVQVAIPVDVCVCVCVCVSWPCVFVQVAIPVDVCVCVCVSWPCVFVQVAIPIDAQRNNDRVMEEIVIPHTSSAPPSVGEDRVEICELDEIAKLAFKGTKTLNRIQTVVFDAAYYTNENLLISAPTGAGKTNIAMLTVLHEIKSNIDDNGVINTSNFKVRMYVHVCTYMCACVHMYVRLCACMHACMCVCTYIRMCMCMCVHVCTYNYA